jgi:hypothetical protein
MQQIGHQIILLWRRLTVTIYGLDVHRNSIHGRCKRLSFFCSALSRSRAHPVTYPLGTGVCFHVAREAGPWPLTSIRKEWESYISTLPSPPPPPSIHQWLYSHLLDPGLFFSSVIFLTQSVGLLGRVVSP